MHPQQDSFSRLDAEQNSLKAQLDAELQSLRKIDAAFMLSPTGDFTSFSSLPPSRLQSGSFITLLFWHWSC